MASYQQCFSHFCTFMAVVFQLLWIRSVSGGSMAELRTIDFKTHVFVDTSLVQSGATVWVGTDYYSITTVADERDVTVSIQNMGSNPTSGKTSYYITAEVGTVRPEYAHTIRVYVGPEHLLRARPMFQLNQADFYHMDFKRLLNPQAQVFPRGALGVLNSFMTKQNYKDLRDHSKTKLYLPTLLFGKPYTTILKFEMYSSLPRGDPDSFHCDFTLPDKTILKALSPRNLCCDDRATYIKEFDISPTAGIYIAKCWMKYYHTAHNSVKHQVWKKHVEIVPFTEPLVRFMLASGEAINQTIVYPPSSQKSSASFEILIYTTLRVTSVLVERSDGKTLEQPPVVEFLVHPPGEIIAKYRVTYPWLSSDLDGEYSITVENVKGMVSHTLFNILKAEALSLQVSPQYNAVEIRRSASFYCMAQGYPLTSLSWSRDIEPLNSTKDISLNDEGNMLKLTFHSPNLNDSGRYICTVSNLYQHIEKSVNLAVYPPGSLYVSPEDYPPEDDQLGDLDQCETFSVPNVLTISEAELMAEWDNWSQEHDSSEMPVVLVLLGIMATLATCLGAVLLCRCRKRKTGHRSVGKGEERDVRLPLTRDDSRMELIPGPGEGNEVGEDMEWFATAGIATAGREYSEPAPMPDILGLQILAGNLKTEINKETYKQGGLHKTTKARSAKSRSHRTGVTARVEAKGRSRDQEEREQQKAGQKKKKKSNPKQTQQEKVSHRPEPVSDHLGESKLQQHSIPPKATATKRPPKRSTKRERTR